MWIVNENEATKKIYREGFGMDEPVVFSDKGKAQVTKKAGKKLIKEYDSIKPVEKEKKKKAEKSKTKNTKSEIENKG